MSQYNKTEILIKKQAVWWFTLVCEYHDGPSYTSALDSNLLTAKTKPAEVLVLRSFGHACFSSLQAALSALHRELVRQKVCTVEHGFYTSVHVDYVSACCYWPCRIALNVSFFHHSDRARCAHETGLILWIQRSSMTCWWTSLPLNVERCVSWVNSQSAVQPSCNWFARGSTNC